VNTTLQHQCVSLPRFTSPEVPAVVEDSCSTDSADDLDICCDQQQKIQRNIDIDILSDLGSEPGPSSSTCSLTADSSDCGDCGDLDLPFMPALEDFFSCGYF
jgi:hypothetical protein